MNIKELENIDLNRTIMLTPQHLKRSFTPNNNKKLNIVYLMVWTQVCGGSKVILEYANRISQKGHTVTLISYDRRPNWFPLNDSINFIQVPSNRDWKDFIPKCDVLVATSWKCIYTAIESEKGPVVFFEQGGSHIFDVENLSQQKINTVKNRLRLVPFVYTVSSYAKEKLKEIYDVNSSVICIAVDNNIFYPRENSLHSSQIEITIIGSEDFKFKNIPNILQAFRILSKQYSNLHLNWISQTDPQNNPEPAIVNPPQKTIGDILRKTDIYICNSEYESFGLPTLEAMCCGAAVITTDTGGMRDFAINNENALFTKKDDINDIVNKVKMLIEDPLLRQRLSTNGLITSQKFNWEDSVSKTLDYYRNVASYTIDKKREESER